MKVSSTGVVQARELIPINSRAISRVDLSHSPNLIVMGIGMHRLQSISLRKVTDPMVIYAIEGKAVLTIDDQLYRLEAGSMAHINSNTPFAIKASTDFKMLEIQ